ncbi:hypothetical protein TNCV_5050311 [Trichonephila clavipes]|nr:hypothetical protein TNCV_5050311 [Trichonephila clavipes]
MVSNHLHVTYPGRWIGRSGPVAKPPRSRASTLPGPPRSSGLHLLDFLYGNLKLLVYETPVTIAEDLAAQIVIAST